MSNDRLEINRLKVRKEHLFAKLKKDYDQHYRGAMHFDIMSLANLYSEHRCGIESEFSKRATEIEEIDQLVEEKQNEVALPKWRAARLIANNLLQSGRIDDEEQIEKAATFLTEVEEKLSTDDVTEREVSKEEKNEREVNEKLVCFAELLHPWIMEHAFEQYRNGHLRDSVLNAYIALGDLIREKTGIQQDGSALATKAFSLKDPKLIFSDIVSDSGKNDQIGFMQIIQGSFTGIRNPKAHSIRHDLTEQKAAQYLVLASLLARRISEASVIEVPDENQK
ncbi:MAG: TIGR02391 family protein [Gammaproteobacteria bacterium]|nr:TIGR02391 family protein [Gammaproteobacteria bacterium]